VSQWGLRYYVAAMFGHIRPVSASSATLRGSLLAPMSGPAREALMACIRPLSPADPLDRLLGEAPAM
jgi:hypothetical protein